MPNVLPIDKKFFTLTERYGNAANNTWPTYARALFVHQDGEPMNNAAEHALQPAVQWRKTMFGNRSDDDERVVERPLTVTRTCRLQQLDALVYLDGCDSLPSPLSSGRVTAAEALTPDC